ncbi:metal-dependent hydrolase [Methylococcaceae bacterium CS5]|nr:metal-dependent hydrolase [Methylococcaceae bacterium CS5]TXL04901.1 metal-dependent hydrolase [Methylococcaceae bacterium CS3]
MDTVTQERGVIAYGDELIYYDVIRKTAGVKTPRKVTIKVHPDQRVVATVPHDATSKAIQTAMFKKVRWVWQHISALNAQHEHVLARKYLSGETQFYLGRRYMLKVLIDPTAVANVKLLRGKLAVTLLQDNEKKAQPVKALINQWYQYRAEIIFHERLNLMLPKTTWVSGRPSFRILTMKKQWGSCSSKGMLMLNPHLVKAPKECID